MYFFNYDKIKEKEKELTYFKGWLPFKLWLFVDMTERWKFLKSEGLLDEIKEADQIYSRLLRWSEHPVWLMDEFLEEFVEDNPQFNGILGEKYIPEKSKELYLEFLQKEMGGIK